MDGSERSIKVLHLEDVATDAELVARALRADKLDTDVTRVDTADAFAKVFAACDPDIVLLDYNLPSFSGLAALKLVRARSAELPVIMVTGALGDDKAVALVKEGATDYVLKDRLARLGPAVRRALSAVREARARKAAEDASREAGLRYRRLFEAAQDGILIVDFDTARIRDANPFILELLGYTLNEIKGKTLWDIGELAEIGLNKAAFAVLREKNYVGREDVPLQTKGGRRIDVELASNVYDVGGQKTIQCNIRDISDRKRAEAKQRQLAAIVEASPDAIYSEDLRGMITAWSKGAESTYGYAAAEIVGKPVSILVAAGQPDDTIMLIDKARRGETLTNYETQRLRKDGKNIDVSITVSPLRNESGAIVGASVIARDITDEKVSRIALERVNRSLVLFDRANHALVNLKDEPTLLADFCRLVNETGGYPLAAVVYGDANAVGSVRWAAHFGDPAGFYEEVSGSSEGFEFAPSWRAIHENRIVLLGNIAVDVSLGRWREGALKRGFLSAIGLPLRGPELTGALVVLAKMPNAFDESAIVDLSVIAENLALGIRTVRLREAHETDLIERQKFAEQLSQSLEATVAAIASTIEMRDPYTASHQRRVAALATTIARKMGLPEDKITGLRLASLVHDIGKIHVPAEILANPGKLTRDEFSLIKAHTQVGYEVLKNVSFPWPISQMVLQHHERLDGSGYPQALVGDQIITEAKIMGVADVVEAMCSHRPYRPALGIDAALAEIETNRGKLYDPQAVDVCVALFRTGGFAL